MIALSYFDGTSRIYSPVQKCLRKMNVYEKFDYATQLSDYILSVSERKFQSHNLIEI
jgi:hypothetical protein